MSFAIPGIGIGLFFAFLVSIPIEDFVADFAVLPHNYSLYSAAVIMVVVLGIETYASLSVI